MNLYRKYVETEFLIKRKLELNEYKGWSALIISEHEY